MTAWKRTLLRVALLTVSVGLPAGAAELYVRRFQPVGFRAPPEPLHRDAWRTLVHRRSELPGLSYELSPHRRVHSHGAWIETNALGLRSYEPMSRDPARKRIAIVGDSYTFGFGVEMGDTFASVLERALNPIEMPAAPGTVEPDMPSQWELPPTHFGQPSAHGYEVMNFGVGGYSTQDEAVIVEHRVRAFSPSLIVLAYSLNDPENAPVQPVHAYYQDTRWWQHSHVLRLIALRLLQSEVMHYGDGDYHRYLHAHPDKWGSVQRGMARIARAADSMGARVLLAIFPHCTTRKWQRYPLRDIHRQVAQEGRRHGFAVLDLLPTMERQPPLRVRLSPTDDHPNAMGHRLAGLELSAYLRLSGLLDE